MAGVTRKNSGEGEMIALSQVVENTVSKRLKKFDHDQGTPSC